MYIIHFESAKWGASGALYLQSTIVGLNANLGKFLLNKCFIFSVEVKVLCNC